MVFSFSYSKISFTFVAKEKARRDYYYGIRLP